MDKVDVSSSFKKVVRKSWTKGPEEVLEVAMYEAWYRSGYDEEPEHITGRRREVLAQLVRQDWDAGPEAFFDRFVSWLNLHIRTIV